MATNYLSIADLKDAGTFVREAACDPSTNRAISVIAGTVDAANDSDGSKAADLLGANGITVLPGQRVVFVMDTETVMHIRIPHHTSMPELPNVDPYTGGSLAPDGGKLPTKPVDYPYPHAGTLENYKVAVCDRLNDDDADLVAEFHKKRIADYTFGHCA